MNNITETDPTVPLGECRVCRTKTERDDLIHLAIYVAGSEGITVCNACRLVLAEVVRGMMRANISGRKQGYLAAKNPQHNNTTPTIKDDAPPRPWHFVNYGYNIGVYEGAIKTRDGVTVAHLKACECDELEARAALIIQSVNEHFV